MGVVTTRGRAAGAVVMLVAGAMVTAGGASAVAAAPTGISDCTAATVEAAVAAGGSYVFYCGGTIQVPELTATRDVTFAAGRYSGDTYYTVNLASTAARVFDVESGTLTLSRVNLIGGLTLETVVNYRSLVPPSTPNGSAGMAGAAGTDGAGEVETVDHQVVRSPAPGTNGADGDNGGSADAAQGGGIYVASGAAVSLDNVTLSDLGAVGGDGGDGGRGGSGGDGGAGIADSLPGMNAGYGGHGGNGGNGGDAAGGAVYVDAGGVLTASSTIFTGDGALGGAGGAPGSGGDGGNGGNGNGGGAGGNGGDAGLSGSGGNAQGGALYNAGATTLRNVTFTGDAAFGGAGGASWYDGFGPAYAGYPFKDGEAMWGSVRGLGGVPGLPGRGWPSPTNAGNAAIGGAGGSAAGGALYNAGSLTWTGGIVQQNWARGGAGGLGGVAFTGGYIAVVDGTRTPQGPTGRDGTPGAGGSGGTTDGGAVWPDEVVGGTGGSPAGRYAADPVPASPSAANPITASQIMGSGNTVTGGAGAAGGSQNADASGQPTGTIGAAGTSGTASVGDPSFLGSAEPLITSVDPVQGPLGGGNTVVIHGSGFQHPALALAGVHFLPAGDTGDKGLAAVSPVVVSDTEIDVVAPNATSAASGGRLDTSVVVEFTNSTAWPSALDITAGVAPGSSNSYLFALYNGCRITATPAVQQVGQSVDLAWVSDATYLGDTAYLSDADPTATPSGDFEAVADSGHQDPVWLSAHSLTYWLSLYPKAVTYGATAPACTSKVTVTWTTDGTDAPSVAAGNVSVTYGVAGTLSGTVTGATGTPTGSVTARQGSTTIGTATLGAAGTFSLPIPAKLKTAGTYPVTLAYSGDGSYKAKTGTVTYKVTAATPSAITVNSGKAISTVRNVAKAVPIKVRFPTGVVPGVGSKVQLKKGSTVLATATINTSGTGTATIPANKLNAGSNQAITATYLAVAGKTAAKTVSEKITITKVTAKVTASPTSRTVKFGAATTVTITVKPASGTSYAPIGKVTMKNGRKAIASGTLKSGKVTLRLKAKVLAAKKYTLTIGYGGDTNTSAKNVTFTYTVTR